MALIKCKHCGATISDKAVCCPKCGKSVIDEDKTVEESDIMDSKSTSDKVSNNTKALKWIIVACLIWTLICGLTATLLFKPQDHENIQYIDSATDTLVVVTDTVPGRYTDVNENVEIEYGKPKKIGNWYYGADKDPMTDEVSYMAINLSTNKAVVCGESTNLSIYLHSGNFGLVGLGIQKGMFRTDKLPLAYIRFDDGKIETYSVRADTDQNVYLMAYDEIVGKLKTSKKVAVKIECADYRTATFTFNVEGLRWNYGNGGEKRVKENDNNISYDDNNVNT